MLNIDSKQCNGIGKKKDNSINSLAKWLKNDDIDERNSEDSND
jgi:hypothetical protein